MPLRLAIKGQDFSKALFCKGIDSNIVDEPLKLVLVLLDELLKEQSSFYKPYLGEPSAQSR